MDSEFVFRAYFLIMPPKSKSHVHCRLSPLAPIPIFQFCHVSRRRNKLDELVKPIGNGETAGGSSFSKIGATRKVVTIGMSVGVIDLGQHQNPLHNSECRATAEALGHRHDVDCYAAERPTDFARQSVGMISRLGVDFLMTPETAADRDDVYFRGETGNGVGNSDSGELNP